MKMILNEYRLMPWQKEAQELVRKHMEDFFFGEGAALPPATSRSRANKQSPQLGLSRIMAQPELRGCDLKSRGSVCAARRADDHLGPGPPRARR